MHLSITSLPMLLPLLSTMLPPTLSQPISSTNLTATSRNPIPSPGTTWHPPNTITTIVLIQKQPPRAMPFNRLYRFMLTCRIDLQAEAQLAGGTHMPLTQPFQKYSAEFGFLVTRPAPNAENASALQITGQLLYSDVENVFSAVETQIYRLGSTEAAIHVLRWGITPSPMIGFEVVGLKASVGGWANGTGVAIEEGGNVTAVGSIGSGIGTDGLATA